MAETALYSPTIRVRLACAKQLSTYPDSVGSQVVLVWPGLEGLGPRKHPSWALITQADPAQAELGSGTGL